MADSTLPDPYVQKFLNNFEIGYVNAEVDTFLAEKYGVRSFPTLLILKPGGSEIDRHIGYYPPEEFVGAIINSLAGIGTLEDLLGKLSAKPADPQLLYEVGQKYRWRGDYAKAAAYFKETVVQDTSSGRTLSAECSFNMAHMKYKEKNYLLAAEMFAATAKAYPSSAGAVDAELMASYSHQQAGDFKQAKRGYQAFLKKYPETDEKEWIDEQFVKMEKQK